MMKPAVYDNVSQNITPSTTVHGGSMDPPPPVNSLTQDIEGSFLKQPTTNSATITTFLLLNTMIGSGILNQPQVFRYSGILGALLVFLFASFFTWLGMVVLIEVGVAHNLLNYSELTKKAFGVAGEKALDFFIVLYTFGALMSYMTIVGGTSSELFLSWGCEANFCEVLSTTSFFIFVFDLPLCLVRFYGHYGTISVISMISIFAVLCLVLFGGPAIQSRTENIAIIKQEGALAKIGSVVFALACAPASFHAYEGLKDGTSGKWQRVITYSVVIGAIMCCAMGIGGYLVFGNEVTGEIISNFDGVIGAPFKVLLVVHLILYIPIDFVIMRYSLLRLFGHNGHKQGELPLLQHCIVTVIFLCAPMAIVLALRGVGLTQGDAFGFILDFTGGIASSFCSFIMPAMIYLQLTPKAEARWFYPAILMLIFGVFVMFTVPIVISLILTKNMTY